MVFVYSTMSFQYLFERVSALRIPLTATKYYAYKSVHSVESIKILMIIGEEIQDQISKGQNVQHFIRLSALSMNEIMIYTV